MFFFKAIYFLLFIDLYWCSCNGFCEYYRGKLASCHQIKNMYPNSADGMYTITIGGYETKTYCDMTNGGLTLIWSYSETTNYRVYTPINNMLQDDTYYQTRDKPLNFPFNHSSNPFPYENFRMPKATIDLIRGISNDPVLKVLVTDYPAQLHKSSLTDNIYYEVTGRADVNTIFTTSSCPYAISGTGKLNGYSIQFNGKNDGGFIDGQQIPGLFALCSYPLHLNIDGSPTNTAKLPATGLKVGWSENLFGWFGNEYYKSETFGKCKVDVESNSGKGCTGNDLIPRSVVNVNCKCENEKERYIQWYLK